MYMLIIHLIQAQVRGWTSTNECKQKLNKHKWPQTSTNEGKQADDKWVRPGSGDKHWTQTTPGKHKWPNKHDQVAGPSTSKLTAEWAQTRWNEHEQGQEWSEQRWTWGQTSEGKVAATAAVITMAAAAGQEREYQRLQEEQGYYGPPLFFFFLFFIWT